MNRTATLVGWRRMRARANARRSRKSVRLGRSVSGSWRTLCANPCCPSSGVVVGTFAVVSLCVTRAQYARPEIPPAYAKQADPGRARRETKAPPETVEAHD